MKFLPSYFVIISRDRCDYIPRLVYHKKYLNIAEKIPHRSDAKNQRYFIFNKQFTLFIDSVIVIELKKFELRHVFPPFFLQLGVNETRPKPYNVLDANFHELFFPMYIFSTLWPGPSRTFRRARGGGELFRSTLRSVSINLSLQISNRHSTYWNTKPVITS